MTTKKKVLLIDDESSILDIYKIRLEQHNLECITASTPMEGFALLEKEVPDLILLDLMMPQMSGFGFLREIKRNPKFKNIPVVIFTVLSDDEVVNGAFDIGADDFVTKSPDYQQVLSTVSQYLH